MDKKIIEVRDTKLRGMKDSLEMAPSRGLRGHVEIYEKRNGQLERLQENHNLIVFGGREWLLKRAFGQNLTNHEQKIYNKTLSWFGVGTGGGEPGNPLQAGAVRGNDTQLISHTALRAYNSNTSFRNMYCRSPEKAGGDQSDNKFYYKKFSSVVIKEDVSNPYLDGTLTKYPPIVAEVRIELSSQDACTNDEYTDLNEAALFASTIDKDIELGPDEKYDARSEHPISPSDTLTTVPRIQKITVDGNEVTYQLRSKLDSFKNVHVGDLVYITRPTGEDYTVPENDKAIIIDVNQPEEGSTEKQSFTIEIPNAKPDGETFNPANSPYAYIFRGGYEPFTMFSRVTFSTIRKTTDREIVFLWKVYF